MQEFPEHTGYSKLFKVLEFDVPNQIKHGLKLCPLVDVYELLSFEVICADDDEKHITDAKFFLYHTSEKKIRHESTTVEIEETGGIVFRIPLEQLLAHFKVAYSDESSLGDLETELWTAMFSEPSDAFDPAHYCHSPWYERCCREERTVGSLKSKGDWDELWLKMVPCKVINPGTTVTNDGTRDDLRLPRSVHVAHNDFDTATLALRERILGGESGEVEQPLCVMVLLKV